MVSVNSMASFLNRMHGQLRFIIFDASLSIISLVNNFDKSDSAYVFVTHSVY